MNDTLRSALPELYHPTLPALFDRPAPREEKATCSSCAMCRPEGAQESPEVVYFRPDAKCCTYHPKLPNYLVGAILADERPDMAEGRRRIQAKIANRIGVGPQWLSPPRKHSVLFEASRESSFGRSLVLRCPYFEAQGGLCTIWRHRDADCSTFFCKYTAGADGQTFWRSLNTTLRYVELKLSEHAMRTVAPGLTEPPVRKGHLSIEDLEDRPPAPEAYASFWGAWEGREEAYYRACRDCVAALDAAGFARILGGEQHEQNLRALEQSHGEVTTPKFPERLMLREDLPAAARKVDGGHLVSTYSRYEPLLLSPDLFEVLQEFKGDEPVSAVKARLLRDAGVEVPDAMLIALYQMRVLVTP